MNICNIYYICIILFYIDHEGLQSFSPQNPVLLRYEAYRTLGVAQFSMPYEQITHSFLSFSSNCFSSFSTHKLKTFLIVSVLWSTWSDIVLDILVMCEEATL